MAHPPQKLLIAIALIVLRLVMSGSALAMPMVQVDTVSAPVTMSDCAEHSAHHGEASEAETDSRSSTDAAHDDGHQKDCCKQGGCECPCLHGGVASLALADPVLISADASLVPSRVDDRPHIRPNLLFRPPA